MDIEEICALVNPQEYIAALQDGQQKLRERRAALAVDYQLTRDSPELNVEQRTMVLKTLEQALRDCHWRITEIDTRVEKARNGAMGR